MQLCTLSLPCLTFLLMAQNAIAVPVAFERGATAPLDGIVSMPPFVEGHNGTESYEIGIGTIILDVNLHKRSPGQLVESVFSLKDACAQIQ